MIEPHTLEALGRLLDRAERVLARLEGLVGDEDHGGLAKAAEAVALRWRARNGRGRLEAVRHPHRVALSDLLCIDAQKDVLAQNTRQFLLGLPANNALLSGARGTGKSSLVKALLHEHASAGLRLVQIERGDLADLPDVMDALCERPERFVLFCDDLSFEADDASYKSLKAMLEGSIVAQPENVLIYATSNRRHLIPEYERENLAARAVDGEIHHGEAVEEKTSLAERFGIWVSFYPMCQDEYLQVVRHWLAQLGMPGPLSEQARAEALRWALRRGSRSGRSAWQFARDWVGRERLRQGDSSRRQV